MLGTLMKYEFKAVGRLLLPLYGAWLIAAILLGLSLSSDGTGNSPLFITLTSILYAFFTVSAVVITAIILIQRFYKNLLGNEGYFMFALPVSTGRHLANKIISGAVWTFIGVVVAMLTAFAIIITIEGFQSFFDEMHFMIGEVRIMILAEPSSILYIIELLIIAFLAMAETVAKVYASIAIGHQWSNHRVLGAILAYIGVGIIETIIANIISFFVDMGLDNWLWSIIDNLSVAANTHLTMLFAMFVTGVLLAIYWFVCWKLLDKKLNLE